MTTALTRRAMATSLAALGGTAGLPAAAQSVAPDAMTFAEVINGTSMTTDYHGRKAVRLVLRPELLGQDGAMLAVLDTPDFHDGRITLDVAGKPREGSPADARGFIGLAFRTQDHGVQAEIIYLRPTNGRAGDQLRRNHAVQYESRPDYPWYRLREENPGAYESYADLAAGEWTRMTIVVAGTTARLYVNDAVQPCLVVTDLKHGDSAGRIALWSHFDTEGYFGPVTIDAV